MKHATNFRTFAGILTGAATLILSSCSEPRAVLKGSVIDEASSKRPLEGVKIEIEGLNTSCLSAADGTYALPYLPGSFAVQYSKENYVPVRREFNIQTRDTVPVSAVGMYHINLEGLSEIMRNEIQSFYRTGFGAKFAFSDMATIHDISYEIGGDGDTATLSVAVSYTMLNSLARGGTGPMADSLRPIFKGVARAKGETFTENYTITMRFDRETGKWQYPGLIGKN